MPKADPHVSAVANLIECVGYTQERLHSGLLKLAGTSPDPVRQAFFDALGLPDPSRDGPCKWDFEKHKIDLVVTLVSGEQWGIEFKVDGNPTANQLSSYVEHVDRLLFVTLGMAEDMATFCMPEKASHIGLEKWCEGVARARERAPAGLADLLGGYKEKYDQEILHRKNVGPQSLNFPRHAFGRIRLLGCLARELREELASRDLGHEIKTYGVQGDVTFTMWGCVWRRAPTLSRSALRIMENGRGAKTRIPRP